VSRIKEGDVKEPQLDDGQVPLKFELATH